MPTLVRGTNEVKDILIQVLRHYLSNVNNYKGYVSVDFRNVPVFDKMPETPRDFPFIIISNVIGNNFKSGFRDLWGKKDIYIMGENPGDVGHIETHMLFTGGFDFNYTIYIISRTTREREDLLSVVWHCFNFDRKWQLLDDYNIVLYNISNGGESEINLTADSKTVFVQQITLNTRSYWIDTIPLSSPALEEMSLTVTVGNEVISYYLDSSVFDGIKIDYYLPHNNIRNITVWKNEVKLEKDIDYLLFDMAGFLRFMEPPVNTDVIKVEYTFG